MNGLEFAPFSSKYTGLGLKSCDSVVGILENEETKRPYVVKWNRRHFTTPEETFAVCQFVKKSVALYTATLGEEFIVPTSCVVGEKLDNGVQRYKVYTIQPFIDGWTAKTLPDDLSEKVADQWNILNSRLFRLYNTAYHINKHSVNPAAVFPVTLTVGSSRRAALIGKPGGEMPKTPNLLISRNDFRLCICDFGEYISWQKDMQSTFDTIMERAQTC